MHKRLCRIKNLNDQKFVTEKVKSWGNVRKQWVGKWITIFLIVGHCKYSALVCNIWMNKAGFFIASYLLPWSSDFPSIEVADNFHTDHIWAQKYEKRTKIDSHTSALGIKFNWNENRFKQTFKFFLQDYSLHVTCLDLNVLFKIFIFNNDKKY